MESTSKGSPIRRAALTAAALVGVLWLILAVAELILLTTTSFAGALDERFTIMERIAMVSFNLVALGVMLILAVRMDDPQLVRFLLEQGAHPNIPTAGGQLPLDFARGNPELSQLLRDHGASGRRPGGP